MAWKPEFALLILFSTVVDYFCAKFIDTAATKLKRKLFLGISLSMNLGLLFYFKYFNFFIDSIVNSISTNQFNTLDIILPVGISFYTFQTLSYTIDVYRGQQRVENNFITFALYVSYFPQLVAGPIERSTHLLPQLKSLHDPTKGDVRYGAKLIIWGMFKKVVIADRLAPYVDSIYGDLSNVNALSMLLATYFFSIQIYCDFSGYTDIARGIAKFMGVSIMKNFNQPYFAKNISEFWARWHISLSTWFRDYLYIPLGGNRVSKIKWFRNIAIVFIVSGFWHGANWTFIVWGALHAFYFLVEKGIKSVFSTEQLKSKVASIIQIFLTYHLVLVAWVFFRAKNIEDALYLIKSVFTNLVISKSTIANAILPLTYDNRAVSHFLAAFFFIFFLKFFELRKEKRWLFKSDRKEYSFYIFVILLTLYFGKFSANSFIYFQF